MCGILGFYNLRGQSIDRSEDDIVGLRDMMCHRGPDAYGYRDARDRSWALAHRRLSILDLSEQGRQPMSDPSGRVHICYNGEIYNYRELQKRLASRGHTFVSASDTEVILHLYLEMGVDCLPLLRGMFAIIIVDEVRGCMVIARDPVGKKPLYYGVVGNNVIVASEPGVISRDRSYQKRISPAGLYSLLTMGAVKSPDSLFAGIRKLEPGCYRIVDGDFRMDGPSTRFFAFDCTKQNRLTNDADAVDRMDALLDQAVERRMISDVPFGIYLSAGIDSALILSYMSRHTDRVNTFSIDMAMSESSRRETDVARALARQFGTNHHEVQITDDEYVEILDGVILQGSTMAMPDSMLLVKLSQLARAHGVYVIETGEGADELFFGYQNYLPTLNQSYAKMHKWRGMVPRAVARVMQRFGTDAEFDHASYVADAFDMRSRGLIFSDFHYQPFLSYQADRRVRAYAGVGSPINKFEALNQVVTTQVEHYEDYAPSTLSVLWNVSFRWADLLLDRIDSATMSAGVEGRAPFLDVDVINFSLSLTDELKVRNGSSKYILRRIAERRVSPEHAALPKRGFGGGNDNMLNDTVSAYLTNRLATSASYRDAPLMEVEKLQSRSQLFTIASFHAWVDKWM
jgi:asparagine synthase (glutamine-hydrolysing)